MGKSAAPVTDARLDDLRAIVRQAGLKCTPARLAVLGQLAATHGPSSHAEIHEALAGRGFDRATIYRNLSDLQEHRLVSRVDVGDQAARYELTSAHDHGGTHPHFRCDACGDVLCVEGVRVVLPKPGLPGGKSAAKQAGGHRSARTASQGIGSVTEIVLRGLCTRCG